MLSHAEWDVKKEAAWAISNATSGGSPDQIEYLVARGCVPPLCDLLTVQDNKIVTVALEGLANILKVGESAMREKGLPENPCAQHVENAGGLDKIDALQQHEDVGIYEKSLKILEQYFGAVEDDPESQAMLGEDPLNVEVMTRRLKQLYAIKKKDNGDAAAERAVRKYNQAGS